MEESNSSSVRQIHTVGNHCAVYFPVCFVAMVLFMCQEKYNAHFTSSNKMQIKSKECIIYLVIY